MLIPVGVLGDVDLKLSAGIGFYHGHDEIKVFLRRYSLKCLIARSLGRTGLRLNTQQAHYSNIANLHHGFRLARNQGSAL